MSNAEKKRTIHNFKMKYSHEDITNCMNKEERDQGTSGSSDLCTIFGVENQGSGRGIQKSGGRNFAVL